MSAEPSSRAWRTPPVRHPDLGAPMGERRDTPLGAFAIACFLLAIVMLAILLPELR